MKRGVAQEGDNFALAIVPTHENSEFATGADFDSTAEEVTEWYTRTDEDGNPVEYDYATGEYVGEGHTSLPDAGPSPSLTPRPGPEAGFLVEPEAAVTISHDGHHCFWLAMGATRACGSWAGARMAGAAPGRHRGAVHHGVLPSGHLVVPARLSRSAAGPTSDH